MEQFEIGDPRLPLKFWKNVQQSEGGCWVWMGNRHYAGYGRLNWGGKTSFAHRVAYIELVGDIPDGCELDHLCRAKGCCNPRHLEPVSHAENMRRSPFMHRNFAATWEERRERTHCIRGHEYTPENTKRQQKGRICVTCRRETLNAWQRAKRVREKEMRHAGPAK